jgi:type I restriction enzyme, S subunit
LAFIDENQAAALSGVAVNALDVLINITGDSVARVCMVDPDVLPARVNQHVSIIRADPKEFDQRFLFYSLVEPQMKQRLLGLASAGATRNALTKGDLEKLKIARPPVSEQRLIANLLGALDDKIELNRRMAQTLELIAQTVFEDWLRSVPVGPKVKAQALIERGVLAIGDGYRAKNSELYPPGLPFLRAANLANGFNLGDADIISDESVRKAGTKVSQPGDIAFTSKGTIGRFARVDDRTATFVYSPQVCFWRSADHEKLHPAVLYCWMRTGDFQNQVLAAAGQTDMAPYISLRDQREIYLPLFPINQTAIGETLNTVLTKRAALQSECYTLAELRDNLLPKLISGELRIADAEKRISAA